MNSKVINFKNHKEIYLSFALSYNAQNLQSQLKGILSKIKLKLEREGGGIHSLIKMAVFAESDSKRNICKNVFKEYYQNILPPTSFLAMPPLKKEVAVEAWANISKKGALKINYPAEFNGKVALIEEKKKRYAYLSGFESQNGQDIREAALNIYKNMGHVLTKIGFKPEDVFRYWIYLRGINSKRAYPLLNQARTEYFKNIDFNRNWKILDNETFPASTGIGAVDPQIMMEAIALQGKSDLIPIENPAQMPTKEYNMQQSKGKHTPKFCRAIIEKTEDFMKIFVSGTASIVGGQTRYSDNVEMQTNQTISNIKRLISKNNLEKYGIKREVYLKEFTQVRVYVKNKMDFEKVKAICDKSFLFSPILYLNADICRENLLVEIEGLIII